MSILTRTALTLLLIGLFQLTPAAFARGDGGITRAQAVKVATARYPGKVVKISNDAKFYQIRVLQKNGRVVVVKIDKKSGRVIHSH